MKPDATTTILNFVLLVLAICGLIFSVLTFSRTRELRMISPQASMDQQVLTRVQALANEVAVYNQKYPSPELTKILQTIQPKPAAK